MHVYGKLIGSLSRTGRLSGTLRADGRISGQLTVPQYVLPPAYGGTYEVTPSQETQILETDALYMRGNITINPIPHNYGLITYDGSGIRVS